MGEKVQYFLCADLTVTKEEDYIGTKQRRLRKVRSDKSSKVRSDKR